MASLRFTEGALEMPTALEHTQQLLPNVVDGMARTRPEAQYALIPRSYTSYKEGFRKVTYRQLANAVNGVAWILSEQLGRGSSAETLAHIGPNDIEYLVVILGASKAGYVTLLPSPRNTRTGHANLFAATRCRTLLTLKPPYAPAVSEITEAISPSPRLVHLPNIYDLLDNQYSHFPYPYAFESLKSTPLAIVHTSGTTGRPKPITYMHQSASCYARLLHEPAPDGYDNLLSLLQSGRTFAMFPFFHLGALHAALCGAIISQTTMVTPLAGVPLSIDSLSEALKHVDVDTLLLPAPFVEQISKDQDVFALVKSRVRTIGYGGSDISTSAGNALVAAGVMLVNCYGSTETMTLPGIRLLEHARALKDWQYLQPHPCSNTRFEPIPSQPDLCELIIVRNRDPHRQQPVSTILPPLGVSDESYEDVVYRTRDLWSAHPDRQGLWRYRGRADEVIVLATGELVHPLEFEQLLESGSQDVAAALMIGTDRSRTALLVELTAQAQNAASANPRGFVEERLWPAVERANDAALLSTTARIPSSDNVLLTSPDCPLPMSNKGTVQRVSALALYAPDIEDMYKRNLAGKTGNDGRLPVHIDLEVRT